MRRLYRDPKKEMATAQSLSDARREIPAVTIKSDSHRTFHDLSLSQARMRRSPLDRLDRSTPSRTCNADEGGADLSSIIQATIRLITVKPLKARISSGGMSSPQRTQVMVPMSALQKQLEFFMQRLCLIIVALVTGMSSAFAQSRDWVPWREFGGGPSYSNPQAPRPQRARPPRAYSDDDDDDGYGSPFGAPGGQIPYRKSTTQYPAVLQGGARPEISPQAPQTVPFRHAFNQGSIVIDSSARALYYVLGNGAAYRYPISVGREGFSWRGTEKISRVAAWPDWHPPAEMRERDPRLPEVMTGGINNPLGAKALYLGNSLYRIHGTNDAKSIGYAASSGCFRMMNQHVMHLATLAGAGTTVTVLDRLPKGGAVSTAPASSTPVATKVKRTG